MLDVFVMLEGYCNLAIERVHLLEQERECPEELKEAISGLLFASSRCGEFPELLEIRAIFQTRYGKEFAARAIELRNNCGVNTKLIQKLSTRQPDLESRMKMVKEIAAENSIALQLEQTSSASTEENVDSRKKQNQASASGTSGNEEGFSDSMETRGKYKDVADAAQAAFESAAYAAAAARAAVELSRSDSPGPDNQSSPRTPQRRVTEKQESDSVNKGGPDASMTQEINQSKKTLEINASISASLSNDEDSAEDEIDPVKLLEKEIVLKDSDDDESHDSNAAMNHSEHEDSSKQIPTNLRSGLKTEVTLGHSSALTAVGIKGKKPLAINKGPGPASVRTRQVRGY